MFFSDLCLPFRFFSLFRTRALFSFFPLSCVTACEGVVSWWFSFDLVFSTKIFVLLASLLPPYFFLFVLFIEYCLWCCRKTKTLPRWDALRARTKTLKLFNSYCIWLCVCLIYIIYFFVLFVCLQLFCVFIFFFVTWWGFQFILVVSRKSTPNYLFEWEFDFSCFLGRRRKHKLVCVFVLLALTHLVFCFFFSPHQKILVSFLFWIVTV